VDTNKIDAWLSVVEATAPLVGGPEGVVAAAIIRAGRRILSAHSGKTAAEIVAAVETMEIRTPEDLLGE
jgi:hypothetical protein